MKFLIKFKDPRDFQIMVLIGMFFYGLFGLKFNLNLFWIFGILVTAQVCQYLATRFWKLSKYEWKSALISSLSLCLLMKSQSLWAALLFASIAILSKFLIRWNNKHIFNPTNFALVLGILATDQVTVSPTQWGHSGILAFFILCMGYCVVTKALRADITFSFLGTYALIILTHALIVNEPMIQLLQRLQTGSLLIFSFFMISDPKSTPNARRARILLGVTVACMGSYLQLEHKIPAGVLISLAALSLATPFLDKLIPGPKYEWSQAIVAK